MFHSTSSFMIRHLNLSKARGTMRFFAHYEVTDPSSLQSSIEATQHEQAPLPSPGTRPKFSTNKENLQNAFLEYFVRMKVSTKKATQEELQILSELEMRADKGDEAKKNYIKMVKEISKRPKTN